MESYRRANANLARAGRIMSSKSQLPSQTQPRELGVPYASFAQLVRMLLPLTAKVSFYDPKGEVLWISDGLEEPELRMHVEVVLKRHARGETSAAQDEDTTDSSQPTYVFPICGRSGTLVGAIAIVFRDLPANASYRRIDTVQRLLAPLLDILAHAWQQPTPVEAPRAAPQPEQSEPLPFDDFSDVLDGAQPAPAVLRKALSLATHRLQCAFGAFVVAAKPFTLTHRASPDESDLTMNAAIEAVREPMLRLMQVRRDPVVINGASTREQPAPNKLLVMPIRPNSGRLAAMLMLFRHRQDRDFTTADLEQLKALVAQLPETVLAGLLSPAPAPQPAPIAPTQPTPRAAAPAANPARPSAPPLSIVVPNPPRMASRCAPLIVTPDAAATMDERIRAALRDDKFDLYAQRISPLRDESRPARFEVFVRMLDSDRVRAPASFFEAAEANRLMPQLDRWVIRQLLSTLRTHAARVRSGRWEFCINLAAQSLVADRFSEFVVAEVCKSAIPAGLLVFEISEAVAFEHQDAVERLSARLRDVGCRIALDNCRPGLATLGSLHKWPVSCVKIDGSVINKMEQHPRSESVVRAVTELAASMGIETVAERVESAAVCNKLADIGMDYAQGFHFGQPRPLATVFQS
jgi:EAL domain-containing protein (putative c-di-GMP-specific phosphodiesterase class I)